MVRVVQEVLRILSNGPQHVRIAFMSAAVARCCLRLSPSVTARRRSCSRRASSAVPTASVPSSSSLDMPTWSIPADATPFLGNVTPPSTRVLPASLRRSRTRLVALTGHAESGLRQPRFPRRQVRFDPVRRDRRARFVSRCVGVRISALTILGSLGAASAPLERRPWSKSHGQQRSGNRNRRYTQGKREREEGAESTSPSRILHIAPDSRRRRRGDRRLWQRRERQEKRE